MMDDVIYRYKPSDSIKNGIQMFLKANATLSLKDNWKKYKIEQKDAIEREIRILNNMNYCKNPYNKIYKTMFYYFNTMKNKKNPDNKNITTKKKFQRSKKYLKTCMYFNAFISNHIIIDLKGCGLKPSVAYADFKKKYKSQILDETNRLRQEYNIEPLRIEERIKKTYKNQYYYLGKSNKQM